MKKFKFIKFIFLGLFILFVVWFLIKFGYPSYHSAKGTEFLKKGEIEKAEVSFKKSADLGSSVGMYKLAQLYEYTQNIVLAKKYYKLAAENGEGRSYCGLARIYKQEGNIKEYETAEQMNRFQNKGCIQE